ncbi:MAG: hypothetical protein JNG89_00170 [Planctomycetaceae bacterium]|nr:hypothetical protein [Planctomycetaceae bacterium]
MSDVPSFFGFVLVLVGLLYVGGPMAMLAMFKFRCPARILFFAKSEISLPGDVAAYMDPLSAELEELGFEPVSYFCLPDVVSGAKSISVLFSNTAAGEGAIVNCIYADSLGGMSLKDKHVEFVTRFRDGMCVQTNNGNQLSAFTAPPEDHTVQYPDVEDVAELYRRHRKICDRLTTAPRRFRLAEEFHNDIEQYIQIAVIREPIEYQVSRGLFRPAAEGYRLTVLGAFRMTWQELFPWKFIRIQRRDANARRWLAEIGG